MDPPLVINTPAFCERRNLKSALLVVVMVKIFDNKVFKFSVIVDYI
jgi:hypothetical protein